MKSKYLLPLLIAISCNSYVKNSITPSQINAKEWTFQSTPNNLDVVGVVFGLDSHGNYTPIPGGKLQIKTVNSPIVLSEQRKSKVISYGAIASFLKVSNAVDSIGEVGFDDSTKINLGFYLKEGVLTRIDDDIADSFEKQRRIIESNISTLDLDSTRIFLIMETIQSPNVNIIFGKSKSTEVKAFSKLKTLLNLAGNVQITSNNDNELSYNLKEPLVIFYKLKQINVSISRIKGEPLQKVELSLGQDVMTDELIIKNR